MSRQEDNDLTEGDQGKPVKRVRFSEEVENVYEYEGSEASSESVSFGNRNSDASVKLESQEQCNMLELTNVTEQSMTPMQSADKGTVTEIGTEPVSDNNNEVIELSNCCDDNERHSSDEGIDCSYSVNSIINDTALLSLSQEEEEEESKPDRAPLGKCFLLRNSDNKISYGLESETASAKVSKRKVVPPVQKSVQPSRKRSLGEMLIAKQSSKLYDSLTKTNPEIKTADQLKNAVFNAWCEVKSEKINQPDKKAIKPFESQDKKIDTSTGNTGASNVHDMWKRSVKKPYKKKPNLNKEAVPVPEKTKEDIEENKMAFLAWKKKKEEILRHQIAEKYRKEEKERLDKLMNERVRKNDAEEAYSAWIMHKTAVTKMEKKKIEWLLEKDKEKLQKKEKRDDEAQNAYHRWLINKVYSSEVNRVTQDRPPWSPPGKSNNTE